MWKLKNTSKCYIYAILQNKESNIEHRKAKYGIKHRIKDYIATWKFTYSESDCCFLCCWHSSPSTFYRLLFYPSTYNGHPLLSILWNLWKVKRLQILLKHPVLSLSWPTWSTLTGFLCIKICNSGIVHTSLPGFQKLARRTSSSFLVIWQRWTISLMTGVHSELWRMA